MSRGRQWFTSAAAVLLLLSTVPAGLAADPLKIAVIGGGGTIGQRIVREALDRGHHVTVVAREPARVTERHERLSIVKGDVLDSARVAELASGQDVVVSAVGSARARDPDPTLYRKAAGSLVGALRKLGPKPPRLIVVGGAGSLQNEAGSLLLERLPPERLPESLGQKAALDHYRTVSDVPWTYFSPAGRIEPGRRTGVFRLGGDRVIVDDKGESRISMEDYAVAVIDEAERPQHVGRRFTIGY
jgi:putative NADH-flavin reductase